MSDGKKDSYHWKDAYPFVIKELIDILRYKGQHGKPLDDRENNFIAYILGPEGHAHASRLMQDIGPKKKRGRPRKIKNAFLLNPYSFKKISPRGRPSALYYGLPIGIIIELLDEVSGLRGAPKTRREILKMISRSLHKVVGGYHPISSMERAIRRHQAPIKKRTKIIKK